VTLETLTREQLVDFVKSRIRALVTGADVSTYSDWDIEARILSELFAGNQSQAEYVVRNMFPASCDADFLDTHAAARGLSRQPAAKYTGHVVATGTAGVVVPTGLYGETADGTKFVTTADATLATPAWTGKTVGENSGFTRIVVSPNTTGIAVGDSIETAADFGRNGADFIVKAIVANASAVDLYRRCRALPIATDIFNPIAGARVLIEALEAGSAGGKEPWEEITWTDEGAAIPANLDATAVIDELGGGGDTESDQELRDRLIAYDTARAQGSNMEAYRQWAIETPGVRVSRAYVYPSAYAPGVITIVPLGESGSRELSTTAIAEIEAHVAENAPPPDILDVRALDTPATEEIADWGPSPRTPSAPSSYTLDSSSTTTQLELTTDPTGVIEVGDRVLVLTQLGTRDWASVRTVASVTGGGSPNITLTEALETEPTAGDPVTHAGPLTEVILEAIRARFEDMGPGVYDSVGDQYLRHPGTDVEGDNTLRVNDLVAILMALDGVEDCSVTLPSSDVTANLFASLRPGKINITQVDS